MKRLFLVIALFGVFATGCSESFIDELKGLVGGLGSESFECGENGVPSNQIWYTNGSTTEPTEPNDIDAFGAKILSNTYDAEKGCWVMSFDKRVTKIGEAAFNRCDGIESVTIPGSVSIIGERAFFGCSKLRTITLSEGLTTIGDAVFVECGNLRSITIPESVERIGIGIFCECSYLAKIAGKFASEDGRSLIVGDVLKAVAPSGLTEYAVPDGVTTIGDYALCGCKDLKSVAIGDGVTMIGKYALSGCSSLTSATLGESVAIIEESAFGGCLRLTSLTIPDSVTSIGNYAFSCCLGLQNVTFGKNVTSIGEFGFHSCSSLASLIIPDGVTVIRDNAFSLCASLESVTIPANVTAIEIMAFHGCSSLTSVYCKAITPPAGDFNMFNENANERKIYVLMWLESAYKSAPYWSDYADDIIGYVFEE